MLVQVNVDDIIFGSTKKSMCTEFEEVKQQPNGIFVSQDKYVADILKKFDFCSIKTTTTPIESNKPLVKDEDGVEEPSLTGNQQLVDVNFLVEDSYLVMANSTTKAEYVAAAHCCGQNPVYHSRTKHIEIRHHFIKDCYEKRLIDFLKIHTDSNVTDLLTKGFDVTSMDLRMDRSSSGKYNSSMVFHMANLKYSDKHNMVAFLKKPNESVGFTEVVDFLKGTSLRYALTHNPTIYDSLVKQFWQTATVRTLANGTQQLVSSIDSKEYTIIEASVRSKLQLAHATGIHNLSDAEEKINTGKEEINTGKEEINTGIEEVNTGSTKVDSGTTSKRGQREGKAPMVEEDIQATHKTKEQMRQEKVGLEEAIKLQAQLDEEVAKQIHLDKMIAKRMAEEEALTEQQKKRKAQLEANAEFSKDVLGQDLPEQDFAKRMAEMVKERKKHFAEERAKAKRNKPMTQSQLRIYMSNYLKNQGTWKLSQLKKLKIEEIKEEFDKYGEELQIKTSKKQKIDDKDVPAIGEKVVEVKEEEQVKRTGKRKKQKARKGINVDKSAQEDSETDKEESVEAINPTPLTTKSDSVVNWKIFQQGQRSIYQIMRANGADTVYMSFGAMIKDFTREDLIELYRLVMQKYGTNRPEDAYDRVLWSDLRTMFDPPLIEDAIWSLPLQQKMVSWRYYDKCEVHCLTLEACTIYMLADRKYPLSKEACQVMLKMKLLDGKMNEVCYKLLKMIEKQAGIRK
ncbi:putative ribonuclease H-like domain-containing protein [Tanacetum coccineum]